MKKIAAVFFALLFIAQFRFAYAAIFIDSIYTTDKGRWCAEFSADYYRDVEKEFDDGAGEHIKTSYRDLEAAVYLSYGLTEKWDAGITVPYQFINSSEGKVNGFSDIVVESKYRFFDEKEFWPGFALYFDVKPHTANEKKGLSSGRTDYTLNTIFTKNIGENSFDLNLGYIFIASEDDAFYYAFDIERALTDKLSICAEIYGENTFKGGFDDNILIGALSFSYGFNDFFSFEIGAGAGISKASPDYQLSTTLSFNF